MNARFSTIVPFLAGLASGCSPSFEADLPDVEITQRGLKIAGVPEAALVGDVSVASAFTLSASTVPWAKRLNAEVRVHQVAIAASDERSDLGIIAFARVTAANPAIPGSAAELLSYARTENPSGSAIEVSLPTPVDITSLWSSNQVLVELQVAGQLPKQDWTVDVTLSLSGRITGQL
jgi:hypothetical protein